MTQISLKKETKFQFPQNEQKLSMSFWIVWKWKKIVSLSMCLTRWLPLLLAIENELKCQPDIKPNFQNDCKIEECLSVIWKYIENENGERS